VNHVKIDQDILVSKWTLARRRALRLTDKSIGKVSNKLRRKIQETPGYPRIIWKIATKQFHISVTLCLFHIQHSARDFVRMQMISIVIIMPPPLIGRGIKRCFCLTSVTYIGPKSRTERPRKTKIGTEVALCSRHQFQGQKFKGQGHQAALLTAMLRHQAAAEVSVGTYCYVSVGSAAWGAHWGRRGSGSYCVATHTAYYYYYYLACS